MSFFFINKKIKIIFESDSPEKTSITRVSKQHWINGEMKNAATKVRFSKAVQELELQRPKKI